MGGLSTSYTDAVTTQSNMLSQRKSKTRFLSVTEGNNSVLNSTRPSSFPTNLISKLPSYNTILFPSEFPSKVPSKIPSEVPSKIPSEVPSKRPSEVPSKIPTVFVFPSGIPTSKPSLLSTSIPSLFPTPLSSQPPSISQNLISNPP